jgi:hypothetical protein
MPKPAIAIPVGSHRNRYGAAGITGIDVHVKDDLLVARADERIGVDHPSAKLERRAGPEGVPAIYSVTVTLTVFDFTTILLIRSSFCARIE